MQARDRQGVGRKLVVGVVAVAAALAITIFAGPASGFVSATINAVDNDYDPTTVASAESDIVVFDNNGGNTHTATADKNGPDKGPFFDTGRVSGGLQDRPVNGTQFLEAGDYDFHCEIHSSMHGTLTVANSAPGPVPRPQISVKVKSKKLEKVVDSGKLKVEVLAVEPTDAEGISLQAKKGRKTISKKANLDLGAGNSATAKLKLKKTAAEKLADLDKAKVKVSGTVEFGFGDKAAKKLK